MCTNVFTDRFEVEHIVHLTDLQCHLVFESLTTRIKELHPMSGDKSVMFIHPEMLCRLITGMDEFVEEHIFVQGSTTGATLAIDMGNGMVSSLVLKS